MLGKYNTVLSKIKKKIMVNDVQNIIVQYIPVGLRTGGKYVEPEESVGNITLV